MKYRTKNHFVIYFLSFAVFCCLILSILFLFFYTESKKQMENQLCQKKVATTASDLESHLEAFEKLAIQIAINNIYHPSNITSKYGELKILDHFHESYADYSLLTDDFFLCYSGRPLLHVNGKSSRIDIYLANRISSAEDYAAVLQAITEPESAFDFLKTENAVFFLIPVRFSTSDVQPTLLAGRITDENLKHRIEFINGGIDGEWYIYEDMTLLYSSSAAAPDIPKDGAYSASVCDNRLTVYYVPASAVSQGMKNVFLTSLIIFLDIGIIVLLIYLYSGKANESFRLLHEKYQNDQKISEERQMRQTLRTLLNGSKITEISTEWEKTHAMLPGPFYYVISISCEGLEETLLLMIQEKLESARLTEAGTKIYVVCEFDIKQLWVIVSILQKEAQQAVTDSIRNILRNLIGETAMGIGNTYHSTDRISASWLESQDNLPDAMHQAEKGVAPFAFSPALFQDILDAMVKGNQAEARKNLAGFVSKLNDDSVSFLMRQHIFVKFLIEIEKEAARYGFELSNQHMSLIISSVTLKMFYEAMDILICEFCYKINNVIDLQKKEAQENICCYIEAHFTEYDLSIETVAVETNTTVAAVRKSVTENRGMLYRDYVTVLRLDYAKELLKAGGLSVAEISEKIGYSSASYFIKIFKKTVGVTPARYLKDRPDPKE